MPVVWHTIEIRSRKKIEVLDITDKVVAACSRSGLSSGLAVVITGHTTAGVCVNEPERGLLADLERWLERIVPDAESYAHNAVDDNADAHLRSIVLGHSVSVPWTGKLELGTWQRVLFVELDGPRTRHVSVGVVG